MATRKALGIFPDQNDATIVADFNRLQSMGVRTLWLVLDLAWASTGNGTWDSYAIGRYDKIVAEAQARNMPIALQCNGMPTWITNASGHTANTWHGPDTSGERTNWVGAVHNFIARYGSSAFSHIQVWTEPNLDQFWVQGASPSNYVQLLQAVYVDLVASWSSLLIVGHNMARSDFGWLSACYTQIDTIFGHATAQANNHYAHRIGIHPYCGDSTSGRDPAITATPDEGGFGGGGLGPDFLDYRRVRDQVNTHEGAPKNLCLNEFGYPTQGTGWFKTTEANRATWVPRALALARDDNYVDFFNVYYIRPSEAAVDYGTSFNIWPSSGATTTAVNYAAMPDSGGRVGNYNRLVGFFTDTDEWQELLDTTLCPPNKYAYIVVHWNISATALSQIQTQHPNSKILAYQNLGGMIAGPHSNSRPTSLVTQEEATAHGTGADDWRLHKESDGTVVTFSDFTFLQAAHIGRASWRTQAASHFPQIAQDGYDGVFFDDCNMKPGHGFNEGEANDSVEFDSNNAYRDAVTGAMASLKAAAAAQGLLAVPNAGFDPWTSDEYAGYTTMLTANSMDGVVQEYFTNWNGVLNDPPFTGAAWRDKMKVMTDAESALVGNSISILANAYQLNPVEHFRSIDYLTASWWLHHNGVTESAAGYNDGESTSLITRYMTLLGLPMEPKQLVNGAEATGGAWMRHFQYGVVVVNANAIGSGNVVFTLGNNYINPDGNLVSSVTLGPGFGLVLRDPSIVLAIQNTLHAHLSSGPLVLSQVSPTPLEPLAWYVPTGAQNPNGFRTTAVYNALTGRTGSRRWSFRYELLTSTHQRIFDLEEVIACEVEHQYLADIKRQAKFTIRDRGRINYLSNRIRVWVRLHLEPFGTNDWVEWPLGVFLLTSPTRHADELDRVDREVEGFDPLQALGEDLVATRYVVNAGTNIVNHVASLVAGVVPTVKATKSLHLLPATKEWPPGTSKRTIANELLAMAEYESVAFDGFGIGILKPYKPPEERAPMWTYAYGQESLIVPNVDQELDLFLVPNKVLIVVSEPDQPMMVASATNTNPASPTSTVRRGRTIVDFREAEEAATQAVLNDKALRYLREASQIYEHLTFETGLMPIHGTNDIFRLTYDPLAINALYSETSWTISVGENGIPEPMKHEARRLVSV